jgi:3-oxoacyl-[acyl-carrier protein] reductase
MTLSLCLPAAWFLTGAVIPVDGGLMARNRRFQAPSAG